MKRQTIAAIAIAVLLIAGFAYFKFYRTKSSPEFRIAGSWQLDSAYAPSNASDTVALLAKALNEVKESQQLSYEFAADSTLKRRSFKDDITEKYYLRDSVLYISEGADFIPHPFSGISDSLIRFSNADSVVLVFKRK